MANWLDPEAVTLPRLMKQSGYATGHFGKWHLGGQRDVGEAPLITEYGFDQSLTNFEGLGNRVLPLKDAYDGKPPKKHANSQTRSRIIQSGHRADEAIAPAPPRERTQRQASP